MMLNAAMKETMISVEAIKKSIELITFTAQAEALDSQKIASNVKETAIVAREVSVEKMGNAKKNNYNLKLNIVGKGQFNASDCKDYDIKEMKRMLDLPGFMGDRFERDMESNKLKFNRSTF